MRFWALLILPLCLCAPPIAAAAKDRQDWDVVEKLVWPRSTYTLLVETKADADDSPRLRVLRGSRQAYLWAPEGGLNKIDNAFAGLLAARAKSANLVKSAYLFAPAELRDADGAQLLAISGWGFGSDPGPAQVLKFGPAGVEVLFSEPAFAWAEIVRDENGGLRLAGRRSFPQATDQCHQTYDPFAVFNLETKDRGTFAYSVELSRKYNEMNYAWAGPKTSERLSFNGCTRRIGRAAR